MQPSEGNPKQMLPGDSHVPELRGNSVKYAEDVGNTPRPNWEGETTHCSYCLCWEVLLFFYYTIQIKMFAYDLQHCASDSALADVCGKSTLVKFGSFPLVWSSKHSLLCERQGEAE